VKPVSDGWDWLAGELAPGGQIIRKTRLRGGLGADLHAVDLRDAAGSRLKVVVRRAQAEDRRHGTPEQVRQQWKVLEMLQSTGVAVARPLLLDADGTYFGVPTMVMSYVTGHPLLRPKNTESWSEQLAAALREIHSITPVNTPLDWLGRYLLKDMQGEVARRRKEVGSDKLGRAVQAKLAKDLDSVQQMAPTLVHDDFWPGNTIWRRGRLLAVIDWQTVEVGDPRADVSQCRVDIALSSGVDLADRFLSAYQQISEPAPDIWFFDLFRGLRAFIHFRRWILGYHDLGLTDLTEDVAEARVRGFLERALAAVPD
jgi:aminoglycoside phosphotransferase (APT) family kinase protein